MNVLIFGPPGGGKTWLAGTLADIGLSAFLFDLDGGTASIASKCRAFKLSDLETLEPEPGKIHTYRCKTWDDIDVVRKRKKLLAKYNWIILDNATEMGNQAIDSSMAKHPDAKRWDEDVPFRGDYQIGQAYIRKLVRPLCDQCQNVLMICHEAEKESDEGKTIEIRPKVLGKNWRDMTGIFDHIGHLSKSNGVRQLNFVEVGVIKGPKFRNEFQALEKPIKEPTFKKLFERLETTGENNGN